MLRSGRLKVRTFKGQDVQRSGGVKVSTCIGEDG